MSGGAWERYYLLESRDVDAQRSLAWDVSLPHGGSLLQAQTRSADEPMTTFAYCNDCGHRWKVSCIGYRHFIICLGMSLND